jgi:hypothetical protein
VDVEFRRGRVQSQKVGCWSLASGGGSGSLTVCWRWVVASAAFARRSLPVAVRDEASAASCKQAVVGAAAVSPKGWPRPQSCAALP